MNGTDEKSGLKVGQKIKIPAVSALASNQSVKNTETSKNTALESKNFELKNQLPSVISDTHNYSEKKGDPNLVWPVQKPDVVKKARRTTIEKYGVEFPFQNKEILNYARNRLFEKYGVYCIS